MKSYALSQDTKIITENDSARLDRQGVTSHLDPNTRGLVEMVQSGLTGDALLSAISEQTGLTPEALAPQIEGVLDKYVQWGFMVVTD